MLKQKKIRCVFARLGLECPETSAADVKNPPGKSPAMSDVISLHIPLPVGSPIREEVEERICPGLGEAEQFLDDSADDQPGSFELKVTRKNWGGDFLLKLQNDEAGPLVLRMEGASLRGKPRVSIYKDVDPVLVVVLRGKLTDADGETSDQIRRQYVHSQLFATLDVQQASLSEGAAADLEAGVEDAQAAGASGPVEGDRQVGTRSDALPEHTFTSETTMKTCERMETFAPGFTWEAIRIRQKSKPEAAVILGWTEITQAAAIKSCIGEMKTARTEVEAEAAAKAQA